MSGSSSSASWAVMCGILGVLCCLSVAGNALQYVAQLSQTATTENWKRRWNDDTKFFADELKVVLQKNADEASARAKAASQVAVLQAQLEELKKQLAAAPISATPSEKAP